MKKFVLTALMVLGATVPAMAQTVTPLVTNARQAYMVDEATGTTLFAKDADSKMPTSSMSKMMTIYMVFDAIRNGKLHLTDMLPVSEHAWKQEGSRMFVNVGEKVKVEDLIRGVVIQSGNDASVVLAEALGSGSEGAFADAMNVKAKELGMENTHLMNATGLPDPQHYSTAHDLAILGAALIRDFPEDYHYFSEVEFTYNNIKQGNRNPLLYRNMNVDGIKTGHTDVGGYGLTVSAVREGRRLVVVLNGLDSMQARADESANVLDWGFREYGFYPIVKANDKFADAQVWLGQAKTVSVVAAKDFAVTMPRSARASLKTEISFKQPVQAPIGKGQVLGALVISANGMESKTVPLVAGEDVPQLSLLERIVAKFKLFIHLG